MNKLRLLLFFAPLWCFSQNVVFADPNLKAVLTSPDGSYVSAFSFNDEPMAIDANGDGEIQVSEAEAVARLGVFYGNITSLEGLQAFANLKSLDLVGLYLGGGSFDFSAFTNLELLTASYCQLGSVTLSNMNALHTAYLNTNQLTSVTLTNLPVLKNLDLSSNGLQTVEFVNLPQLYMLGLTANQLSSLSLSNMPLLMDVNVSQNQLSTLDVSGLPQLQNLSVEHNQLTSLDVSQNPALYGLYVRQNLLTELTVSGLPQLTQLAAGQNLLTSVTLDALPSLTSLDLSDNQLASVDISGVPTIQELFITSNDLTSLDLSANPSIVWLECAGNQLSTLNITNLTSLSYLGCGYNQLTQLDLPESPYLFQVNCGSNQLTTLDVSGYQYLYTLDVSNNQLATLDFGGLYNLGDIHVEGNQFVNLDFADNSYAFTITFLPNDLLQTVNLKNNGYQSPYFVFNDYVNAPALQFICVDAFEQAEFQYYIQALNPNVIVNGYCTFDLSGEYNIISGTVRFDFNNDGCSETDTAVPYAKVSISDGEVDGATFTDGNGFYSFVVPDGNYTFSIDGEAYPGFTVSAGASTASFDETTFSGTVNADICLLPTSALFDGEVTVLPYSIPYYGFESYYMINVRNKGNQLLSGNVVFNYDSAAAVATNAFPFADATGVGTLTFNIDNLLPFETRTIYVGLTYNTIDWENIWNEAEPISFESIFNVNQPEATPEDNVFSFVQPLGEDAVVENAVYCMEGEEVDPTEIGDYLHYTINFRNTGGETAPFVALKSDIDPDQFDINSIEILNTTMPAQIKVVGNMLELVFEDAQLQPGGEGSVLLRMKSKETLQPGDMVEFGTAVYLDYDTMVQTNMAQTTFTASLGNDDFTTGSFTVYPNPAKDRFRIQSSSPVRSVALYDIQGRKLRDLNYTEEGVSVEGVPAGVYFVKATTEAGTAATKLVKQ
ncbi:MULTISPECIES: T9SS type A sorting domain-containing protein [unclassified Flavobacterium]|uniref:DUF7619 domain-containing protein n=1 Tax=unclassified Flavobacterium TaxID=196869 RepID=UPI001F144630|nr:MULTISPECIES: T9SS type A sorting domain-containing protein [unclassified Flavobacterium]UMY66888.1 T9SS type A sorting domain-containing protein [Flavobacterium sp. HJ-32-4]